jgi:putative heme-binding domain-containing protein
MVDREWREVPSSKLQAPEKLQIPNLKTSISRRVMRPAPTRDALTVKRASHASFGVWSLEFGIFLELGVWSLELCNRFANPPFHRNHRGRSCILGVGLVLCLGILNFTFGILNSSAAEADRTELAVEALMRLQGADLNANPKLKEAVLKVLEKTRGTASFVKLVQQFKLSDQNAGLLEVAIRNSASEAGVQAMRLILAGKDFDLVRSALQGTNASAAIKTAEALGHAGDQEGARLLLPIIADPKRDPALRKQAVRSLAQTAEGAAGLIRLAREEQLADDLKFTASSELNHVRWPGIKAEAAKLLPLPATQNAQPLPPVAELMKMKGDPANGAKVFSSPTTGCANCHQVKGQGTDFGPNLSEIGSKLGKDALFESILDPNAGISFGYEAWQLTLKSGDEAYGLIVSDGADEVAIKAVGGIVTRYKKSDISKREQMKLSVMPVGLQQTMTPQELVDLVEYLSSLQKVAGN